MRNAAHDTLKAFLTILVIFHHSACTYGFVGDWYYQEIQGKNASISIPLLYLSAVNQAFFMGLFFFISGYYTPSSLNSKGSLRFFKDRLIHLGIPILIFGFLLGPITNAMVDSINGQSFFFNLAHRLERLDFSIGPLWFAWALLIFSFVLAASKRVLVCVFH